MSVPRIARGSAILAALVLGGCASAPPLPESMRDPRANFAAYSTYGWAPSPGVSGSDQPLLLLDQNIRQAIGAEMQSRGYTESAENPDLRMAYETASAEKVESNPVRVGIGVGSWGGTFGSSVSVGSPSVRNYREGTLVIHAIDVRRNAEMRQGRISGRITKRSTEPAAITGAVATAMRDFPARP